MVLAQDAVVPARVSTSDCRAARILPRPDARTPSMYSIPLARDREPGRDLKVTLRFIWTLWNTGLTDGRDLACQSERAGYLLG